MDTREPASQTSHILDDSSVVAGEATGFTAFGPKLASSESTATLEGFGIDWAMTPFVTNRNHGVVSADFISR